MQTATPENSFKHPLGSGLWTRWRGYTARWLLFGLLIHVFGQVPDGAEPWWQGKVYLAALGLLFGLACALLFTLAENGWNTRHQRWKTWALVFASWLVVKVVFVSALALMQ